MKHLAYFSVSQSLSVSVSKVAMFDTDSDTDTDGGDLPAKNSEGARIHNPMQYCLLYIIILFSSLAFAATSGDWQHYSVYQPKIERSFVVNAAEQPLKYNHDSSVAWFRDRWFCVWNANSVPKEGAPGQLNYFSTSVDGLKWSEPKPAFSDPEFCANPVPCKRGTQWQPNLIIIDNRLWAVWSQASKDDHAGCYLSVLENPDGKWSNRLLKWDGLADPVIDGKSFRVYPTQNPVRLNTGRVLAPVTLIGPISSHVSAAKSPWYAKEKRDSVIYSDDAGATWEVSPGAIIPDHEWRQWEPTVFEQPDGSVMMFARNNLIGAFESASVSSEKTLTWSISRDGGASWTPHAFVPLQTIVSRMHVLKQPESDRFIMIHNDWQAGRFCLDRINLALFINRGSGMDFVAGTGLTDYEPRVAYPQMFLHGNRLLASYSQGACGLMNMKVVSVSPVPEPDRFYLYPRSNIPLPPSCSIKDDLLVLQGGVALKGRSAPEVSSDSFSCAAWVKPVDGGVFFDNRGGGRGFVWGMAGISFVHLGQPSLNLRSGLSVLTDRWSYVGITVSYKRGKVHFYVNDKHETLSFKPGKRSMSGEGFMVGGANLAASSLPAFEGSIRSFALYANKGLSVADHHSLYKSGKAVLAGIAPDVLLDPSDLSAVKRNFILPDVSPSAAQSVSSFKRDGRSQLRIEGAASAGVELAANERSKGDTVELQCRFMVEKGKKLTLCTVGDVNHPARVVVRGGKILLVAGEQKSICGDVRAGEWQNLFLSSYGDFTKVVLDDNLPVDVRHTPEATWLYLGEGYPLSSLPKEHTILLIDVSSIQTRIVSEGSRKK